jgi:hypothetical protein
MLVVIAFESMFGNTRAVAEAVAEGLAEGSAAGLGSRPRFEIGPASAIDPDQAGRARLLIVGGPTHYHGLSTRSSIIAGRQLQQRAVFAALAPIAPVAVEGDSDLRAWLRCLPTPSSDEALAAAFDTRVAARWAGGAAYPIARRLRRRGYRLAVPPQGFLLEGLLGPVRVEELGRARRLGERLRRQLTV